MNAFTPISETVLSAVLAVYQQTSNITTGLMGLIVSVRIAFLIAQFANASCYGEVFKDLIAYLGVSNLFPMIVKLILDIINELVSSLSYKVPDRANEGIAEYYSKLFGESVLLEVLSGLGDIFIGAVARSAYSVVLAIFLGIAPIIFLVGFAFGFKGKIAIYFSTLIAIALWPVLWNLLGLLGDQLSGALGGSQIAGFGFSIVIYILQICSPIFSIFLFSTLNPAGSIKKVATLVRLK